ncbi:MAG TPA: hypothetical protein VJ486_09080 [Geothrix sp.]|nr:hypothetical protein [Geothrix sp.]
MKVGQAVQILFVEVDERIWPRAEAFFSRQLGLVGSQLDLHVRSKLPGRAAGFDLVSLDGRGLIEALLCKPDLLADLRQTAIVNLHADDPGARYGQLRHLLGRNHEGLRSDGLWVFPQSWMAPWFEEALEFPELGLSTGQRLPGPRTPSAAREHRPLPSMAALATG